MVWLRRFDWHVVRPVVFHRTMVCPAPYPAKVFRQREESSCPTGEAIGYRLRPSRFGSTLVSTRWWRRSVFYWIRFQFSGAKMLLLTSKLDLMSNFCAAVSSGGSPVMASESVRGPRL